MNISVYFLQDFTVVEAENVSEVSNFVLKEFDFGYNDKRDRWLLAVNALKTFANDKV